MLFNSIDFAVFLPIFFTLYWLLKRQLKLQNLLIVLGSYLFYGWWDWRFLSLILFSTVVDYSIGLGLLKYKQFKTRQLLLWTSICVNLGFLGFFKYYNFFLDNFISAFTFFGFSVNASTLNILLPVGISFYTFQTLSYTIDVYKQKLEPTNNFIAFAAFVSFFPQLVAGPIERATNLLSQFYKTRTFNTAIAIDGVSLIIWGLFKKVVIAYTCAIYVNEIFSNHDSMNSLSLLLGGIYFAFQIYGDFSGYSDIAIGVSRLLGISLMRNFNYPYFSRDIAEFWRRWHISLSTWFRDYLYIPLGGSKGGKNATIRNIFIIFIVSGFWHGANWTFIIWGALNAMYFLPLYIFEKNRRYLDTPDENRVLLSLREFTAISTTFLLAVLGWIFFIANNISHALSCLSHLFSLNSSNRIQYLLFNRYVVEILFLILFFVILEWHTRRKEHPFFGKFRYSKIALILLVLIVFGVYSEVTEFIYFQF